MNKKAFVITAIRLIFGVIIYVILVKLFALTPMPKTVIWKVSLGIVISAGLISAVALPTF